MAFTYARRAAVAMASVAVAAGLLATGGSASAATPITTGDRPATVSHVSSPAAGAHHQDGPGHRNEGRGGHDSDRHAHRTHQHGAHHHGDRDHHGNQHRMSDDDLRRQWVLDQIRWAQDHNTRH
ncbi:hypothetical protein [Streptomyces sp. ML-6]|uniref:hypothetical protein n=1 Tax=Streptomyces sp. ML-6 TaxID=2982693 RepID=UPI0024C0079D|nr:hypothetical protein [Streptomyces sp. ML-6]MDK0523869.1 hypothetical protein [Streptomyces sp. ML-6]